MLNIGLIGNTKKLEPHVKQFQKNKSINIIGKSSVGGDNKFSSFHFSVPEFNRIELIERADIIILDNSSAYPFNLISDILKKSKHIYVTEYIDLNINECTELVKLSNEAGSVIQFTNPFFFTPAICWLKQNLGKPFFFNISYLNAAFSQDNLFQLLLMLIEISGISPKKIEAISFQLEQSGSRFNNVRLEFGDASVLNLNYGRSRIFWR